MFDLNKKRFLTAFLLVAILFPANIKLYAYDFVVADAEVYVGKDSGNLYAVTTQTVSVNPVVCSFYLRDHLNINWKNDLIEVLKLQSFLNIFEKESLSLTGVFNQSTFEAVERFQVKYQSDILTPWGDKVTTGFVYILTKKKVNEIYCNSLFPVTQNEQNEIDAFRTYRGSSGSEISTGNTGLLPKSNIFADILPDSNLVIDLKDDSVATSSPSVVKNAAISLFALPQKIFSNWKCLLIALILLIIAGLIIKKLFTKETPAILIPPIIFPDEEIVIENDEESMEEDIENKN